MIVLSETTFVYLYDVAYLDIYSIYEIAYRTISGYHVAFSDSTLLMTGNCNQSRLAN